MKKILSMVFVLALVMSLGAMTRAPTSVESSEFGGDPIIINVPDDYPTIQEAVDAAGPGYMIRVAAGEYGGFLVMGKSDITIIGAEGATVTTEVWLGIDPVFGVETWALAAVAYSENVMIDGLDFDGVGVSQEAVFGIVYLDSTGSISDLTVENIVGTEVGIGVIGVAIAEESDTFGLDLSGITVENSMVGILLGNAEASLYDCTITGMRAAGGYGVVEGAIGVLIGIPSFSGLPVHDTTVAITGTTISDSDVGIHVWGDADLEANFNRIIGNSQWGMSNETTIVLNAVNNWWGYNSGPYHPTKNPTGAGNPVSDNVEFAPWLAAATEHARTETVKDETFDARDVADATVGVTGAATVTVARYASNPGGDPPTDFSSLGKYIDVYVPDTSQVTEIEIRIYYRDEDVPAGFDEDSLELFWYDGTEWQHCSNTGVNTAAIDGYSGYMWAIITEDEHSAPSLARLNELPIDGGITGPTQSPTGGCFIATAAYGTDAAQELNILREFRDNVLMTNRPGAGIVSFYYRTSPPVAAALSRHEGLRTAVRLFLVDPVVNILNRTYEAWSRSDW